MAKIRLASATVRSGSCEKDCGPKVQAGANYSIGLMAARASRFNWASSRRSSGIRPSHLPDGSRLADALKPFWRSWPGAQSAVGGGVFETNTGAGIR
jgi:hypothetical protein